MRTAKALVEFADSARLTVASPFHIDGEHTMPPRPASAQHTEAVLRETGYSDQEIASLRAQGAVA